MTKRINFSKALITGVIIIISNVVILYVGTVHIVPLMWSIGSIGIITFFGTLILVNTLSRTRNLDKGEIRISITSSVIVVYFIIVALIVCIDCQIRDSIEIDSILHSFTVIVGVVIVFYFGSRTIDVWKSKKYSSRSR